MEPVKYKTSLPSSQFKYRDAPSSESLGNIFDLGLYDNWCSVMGDDVYEWLFPVVPKNATDGTSFAINQELWDKAQEEAFSEQQQSQQADEFYRRQADYFERRRESRKQEIQRTIEYDSESNSAGDSFSHDYNDYDSSEAYPLTRYNNR